ncbi:hypothetical protein HMPREF9406_4072 [Clostridium sp. HGF2]|nr:hypothetical protein HMPREF9406_4072 [Clostridium sp. HGF2]
MAVAVRVYIASAYPYILQTIPVQASHSCFFIPDFSQMITITSCNTAIIQML